MVTAGRFGFGAVHRALEVGHQQGPRIVAEKIPPFLYQQLWPYLPTTRNVVLNGIESTIERKVLDGVLPSYLLRYVPEDDASYEEQYVGCLREYVSAGEDVVLVGAGHGVSTVATANQVGSEGSVAVFEGGIEQVERTRRTAQLNDVDSLVSVSHAIISEEYTLRSSGQDAGRLRPSELPNCDTLAIDADGAELPILAALEDGPERLVVEHHAVLDDGELVVEHQPARVRELISDLGYDIIEERAQQACAYGRFEERIYVAEAG